MIASDRWKGSLFTESFILGASGAAPASFGIISLRSLIDYIQERVAVEKEKARWSKPLTPQYRSLRAGDGTFFFTPTGLPPVVHTIPTAPGTPSDTVSKSPDSSNTLVVNRPPSPSLPPVNDKFRGISVNYYYKTADGERVKSALKSRGISFAQLNSVLADDVPTNAILCGVGTPASAIKELALTLFDAGIPIQFIQRIKSEAKNVLYLSGRVSMQDRKLTSRPLSRAQLDSIIECPKEMGEFIANFARFKNPRVTGRAEDSRYISTFFNKDLNTAPSIAAAEFCKRRGHSDVTYYEYEKAEGDNMVALHLGDNSLCGTSCSVFTVIDCQ